MGNGRSRYNFPGQRYEKFATLSMDIPRNTFPKYLPLCSSPIASPSKALSGILGWVDFEFSGLLDYFAIEGFCPFCFEYLALDLSKSDKNVNNRGLGDEKLGLDLAEILENTTFAIQFGLLCDN